MKISNKEAEWISINPPRSRMVIATDLALSISGELSGQIKIVRDGLYASDTRAKLKSTGQTKYVEELFDGTSIELISKSIKNTDSSHAPLEEAYHIKLKEQSLEMTDILYLDSFVFGGQKKNPFKSETRSFPVNFGGGFEEVIISKIVFPDQFEVEEMPKSKVMALAANSGKFSYSTNTSSKMVTSTSHLIINKSEFDPQEYLGLRELYTQVIAKQSEKIILKRKQ
jgi:hypothetical protein